MVSALHNICSYGSAARRNQLKMSKGFILECLGKCAVFTYTQTQHSTEAPTRNAHWHHGKNTTWSAKWKHSIKLCESCCCHLSWLESLIRDWNSVNWASNLCYKESSNHEINYGCGLKPLVTISLAMLCTNRSKHKLMLI